MLSFEELDESMKDHDKSYIDVLIHEFFLVMRFMSVGFILLLIVSIVSISRFIILEKTNGLDLQRNLHHHEEGNESDEMRLSRQRSIQREDQRYRNTRDYIRNRLYGIPFRTLMINEGS